LKLSKTSWLILTIGVFLVTLASLGITRSQQLHEQDQLNQELSVAKMRVAKFQLEQLSYQHEELEKQLGETISQLEAARTTLSQPNESIIISDALFEIARASNVEIIEVSSSVRTGGDLEGVTASELPLTIWAEGDVANLIDFVTRLNGDLTTGVVKSAKISIPETADEGKPSADIRLVVYSYQGD